MNISLLRTVLDRICGLSLMEGTSGPKRPDSLPRIISEHEARTLLACATNIRDVQELLGHASIETTMRYQRCCALQYPELPELLPIEQIPEAPASPTHHAPPSAKTTVTRRILAWFRPLRHPPG